MRSEMQVDLEVPDDFDPLPRDLETAIFRVVQDVSRTFIGIQGARPRRFTSVGPPMMFKLKCGIRARAYRQKSYLRRLQPVRPVLESEVGEKEFINWVVVGDKFCSQRQGHSSCSDTAGCERRPTSRRAKRRRRGGGLEMWLKSNSWTGPKAINLRHFEGRRTARAQNPRIVVKEHAGEA